MKVEKLLKLIQNKNKLVEHIIKSKSGKDFEERIQSELIDDGVYFALTKDKFKSVENYKFIKQSIMEDEGDDDFLYFKELKEISKTPRIVPQPFGKQNSPDFLLIKNGKCLPVEIKFTERRAPNPTWNSGLPRTKYLYIYASYELKDVVFFKGGDIVTETERKETLELVSSARQQLKEDGLGVISNFEIYLRPMYNQKGNIWNSSNREEIQKRALEWGDFF